MTSRIRKLQTVATLCLVVLAVIPCVISSASATPTNAIMNPGFESSGYWTPHYSSFMGSYAKVQDSTYKHSGSYSGLTQTTNPKQEFCSASLYQSLSIQTETLGVFSYWIRKGSSAANGYYFGEASIIFSGGYYLSYYHGFDGSSPPPDSSKYKYIDVGNTATGSFVQIYRNLYNDAIDKFGSSILSQSVIGISLYSEGYKDLETYRVYGQRINWDDLWIDTQPIYDVLLTSSSNDNRTNVGNITFDGTTHELPYTARKGAGSYVATANPPSGLIFDRWETSGNVSVSDPTSRTTTATVAGAGTLKAKYNTTLEWTFMAYMCGDNNLDTYLLELVNDMEKVGSTDKVAINVLLDRSDTDGDPALPGKPIPPKYWENHYYIIQDNDTDTITSPYRWRASEVNMGNPNTLVQFVNRSVQWYPAKRYALILMNHGDGFQGIIQDNQPNNYYNGTGDWLEMPELKQALTTIKNNIGITVNVLGCHACVMSQAEVVYQVNNLAGVFVGSEELEYTDSWPYDWILSNLTTNPTMNGPQLGSQIVNCYRDYALAYIYNTTIYGYGSDVTAVDVSQIGGVAASVSNLGDWLRNNLNTYRSDIDWVRQHVKEYYDRTIDYVDAYNMTQLLSQRISDSALQSLCLQVQQSITNARSAHWHRSDAADSHGLSLFFPNQTGEYTTEYNAPNLDMSTNYNWDEFLKAYLGI